MTITNMSFRDAIEARRSYYNITDESTLSNEQLEELVADAIKYTPSSFNSQTSRAVLVTGEKNKALWNAVWEAHKPNLKVEELPVYEDKFKNSYAAGYGTIVFYEDQDAIDSFVKNFPIVQWTIKDWVQNSNGMAQYIAWTALAANGMGANLQHYGQYSPVNADAINKHLDVPSGWKVPIAMLAFGVPSDINAPGNPAYAKTFEPLVDGETGRVLVRH
ncbi:hypothetical protein CspeluHIS016_0601710 [Cutaneotrichosporon spelunceum]|uniref:Nitroreductase domain-containing protein n=1 Tax=Cutaneotrichosporon spelunceum TaxID=1672016 RepID=A0AAD3TY98_9TREE|nr:hypothetical protein CspeluHIS016_0601710 [Cutaneotrichosporon spelunceum]